MLRRKFIKFYLPCLLSLCLAIACSSNTTTTTTNNSTTTNDSTIPIGIAVAQTSNVALLGQEQVTGAKIAEQYFNDREGINGTPIKLIFQDTGGDEQSAINAFNTLIDRDKVVAIIGPSTSQQAFAADPVADRAGVPVLAPSNTAKGIPQIGKYITRISAPVKVVAPNAIDRALKIEPSIAKVAVFFAQNDAFSKSETEVFQETLKQKNLDIVTVQKFQTTDTDFQSQATNAINLKPDLIIISGLAADGGNLIKQLRELGYDKLIIGGNGLNTSNLFPICQKLCNGTIIAQAYSPELDNPINQKFREIYQSQNKKDPPQFSAQAFTSVQVVVEALQALDKKSPLNTLSIDKLRTQLNEQILAATYETPIGKISFDPEGEIKQEKFYVAKIEMDESGTNGKFTFLE
jgi:branched-chain amino acid transport system substrate-binding protein